MYKKLLKNPAFIFFIIAVLDVILIINITNQEYWFRPLNINRYIRDVTIIFLYTCIPSILLLIIQLLRKIFKNEIVQKVLKAVNILIIICSALFFLLWSFLCIILDFDVNEKSSNAIIDCSSYRELNISGIC